MRINAKFRRAVLASTDPRHAGHPSPPALTDPDVEEGQVIEIEPGRVWITVLHRTKADTWAYSITDHRAAYMGKAGGLTTEPGQAIATRDANGFEPPVVPPEYQKQLSKDAERRFAEMLAKERAA